MLTIPIVELAAASRRGIWGGGFPGVTLEDSLDPRLLQTSPPG